MTREFDAIVVGAGPAGASFATYLGRSRHRVLLLDAAGFPRDKPCGEGIMPAGVPVLRELGVLQQLEHAGAQPIHGVRYSLPDGRTARAGFPSPPAGPGNGLGLRRLALDKILVERARSEATVHFLEGRRVTSIRRCDSIWLVRTAQNEMYHAPLLLGADGYRSTVRKLLGWQRGPNSGRYGVVGHFTLSPDGLARFGPDVHVVLRPGIETYAAPVGPRQALVAVLGDRRVMRTLAGNLAGGYQRLILSDPVLGPLLRQCAPDPRVTACGPFGVGATRVFGDGTILIGDAAGFRDPITGEGLARSLQGARLAASVADNALRSGSVAAHGLAPYADALKQLTRDSDRLTRLALLLCSSPWISRLAMSGMRRDPDLLPRLLGVAAGSWGFGALSARNWLGLTVGV
ncbi:MAG: NAD(P)/FAD-dependent oxidoreductase [Dehalococcoidia bacterium]